MLNQSRVLQYVKDNLGFPFMTLELEDDKILEHVTTYTLREWSYYVPEVKKTYLNLDLEANQVPAKDNEFYITDEQGLEILNVKNLYFPLGNQVMFGQPPIGPLSHGDLREWALAVETSQTVKLFSSYDYTFEFTHPNVVRISPTPNNVGTITVEYERMQPDDLSGIPNELQVLFCDFALADIQIIIGRIRKKYGGGSLRTPFGEIPLESDIFDEGKEKKRELIEKLSLGPLLNVTFAKG